MPCAMSRRISTNTTDIEGRAMALRKLKWWFVVVALLCAMRLHAQESLLIGPGDLLHITVLREPDLEQKVRVRDSGEISIALIGDIPVAGLTPTDAANKI